MSALEYLTANSLTSYPFKSGREVNLNTNHPIADDWFYDLLFVSFSNNIRSVFISKIKKTNAGGLEISFSSVDNISFTVTATIPTESVVNHYKNIAKSFASYSASNFAVKFVFGPGLVEKSAFEQNYLLGESELANSAILLNCPKLSSFSFETYNFNPSVSSEASIEQIHSYSYPNVPTLKLNHNSQFTLNSVKEGSLAVIRGAGAGLYSDCPEDGEIHDVYSLNFVTPDAKGSIFLKPSSCYTANTLTSTDEILYGAALDKYRNFEVLSPLNEVIVKDIVTPGHAITFENFCKPKCPRENLNAFAHYLNRVSDGAQELDTLVSRSVETRGKGNSNLKVFTATDFCVAGDAIFARCDDPLDTSSFIACGEEFIKNYHEGRTLQLYYSSLVVRNYTILEVIDTHSVRLDSVPPPTQNNELLSFRVLDNGVIANLNCASLTYNLNAESFLKTYFKVNYTTNEAFNSDSVYCTNIAVVVSIFNPSPVSAQIQVSFLPTILERIADFKVRTADSIYSLETPELILECRQYAFIETVFSIPCATTGGELSVAVSEKIGNVWTMIGEAYNLPTINGVECPGTVTGGSGGAIKYRINQSTGDSFSEIIDLPDSTISISEIYGNPPNWLSFVLQNGQLKIETTGTPTASTNQRYNLYFRSYGSVTTIWQLVIDYVAPPEIISPLSERFSENSPLMLSKSNEYTQENPVLQIFATNMLISSQDFGDNQTNFFYSIKAGALPTGLVLDTASGKITGELNSSLLSGSEFSVTLSAQNTSGEATNPQTIVLKIAVEEPPVITLVSAPQNNIYNTTNLDVHTIESPLVSFSVLNTPIYSFVLGGNLPSGLYFNTVTGAITGKITETSAGSKNVFISTSNLYGQSNTVSLTIAYTLFSKPSIISPAEGFVFEAAITDEFTLSSPLFTITALQAYGDEDNYAEGLTDATRNYYLLAGGPPGFSLDYYTGKFYGKLDESEFKDSSTAYVLNYALRLGAYNPIGLDGRNIFVRLYSSQTPVIGSVLEGVKLSVLKNLTYTSANPVYRFSALNNPTNFFVTGLPAGLICDATGKITGSVSSSISAGEYPLTVKASNSFGESNQTSCTIRVPVSIITPNNNSEYNIQTNEDYASLFSISACPILPGDQINLSVSGLPPGFTFTNGVVSGNTLTSGAYTVKILASSTQSGSASAIVKIVASSATYSISGRVLDSDDNPVQDISVTDGQGKKAVTDISGNYTLDGFFSGSYNIIASSSVYSIIPRVRQVNVGVANAVDIDFNAEAAVRLVRGFIFDENYEGVRGVIVSDGTREAITDSFGVYELYVSTTQASTITPISSYYVFTPSSGTIPAGISDIENADFSAITSKIATPPEIISITPDNASLSVNFNPPKDSGGTNITNYEYSIDAGQNWNAVSPAKTTSPIVITSGYFDAQVSQLVNGINYSVSLRAVNLSGPGAPSLIFKSTPAIVPLKPTIAYHLVGATAASVAFTLPSGNPGAAILYFEYSIDGGSSFSRADYVSSPLVIPNLTLGNSYAVKIRAVNSKGAGEASDLYTLLMADAPAPPVITEVISQDSQLLVYFELPENDGGALITNVGYSIDGNNSFTYNNPASITSPLVVNNLTNGIFYTVNLRAVNAVNNYSLSSPGILASPTELPDPPTELTAEVFDRGTFIAFTPSANSAQTIINYKYQLNDAAWVAMSPAVLISPIKLTGLTNGTSYNLKLRAVISSGDGQPSETVSFTPAKQAAAPILTSVTPLSEALELFFTKTVDFGGGIFEEYRYSLNNGSYLSANITDLSSTSGKFTVSGLTNGVSYTINLKAKTNASLGLSSNSITSTPRTTPGAPTNLTAAPGNNSATISFLPPSNNGGAAITNYKYQLNDGSWISKTPASSNATVSLSNLINGKYYSIKVKAVNAAGDGPESEALQFVPYTTPSAPTIIKAHGTPNRIQLIFTPPANDGGTFITGYEYSVDGGATFAKALAVNSGSAPEDLPDTPYISLEGLINGNTYNIILRALNHAGWGTNSNMRAGKPVGAPPAPRITSASGTPTGAVIAFSPPATTGGAPITNYAYTATQEGGIDLWYPLNPARTTSPLTIENLTLGELFYVKISAISSYGRGTASAAVSVVPGTPSAPAITKISTSDETLEVYFTPPTTNGASPVTNYLYSVDSGATYISSETTVSPIVIKNLTNGTSYNVRIVSENSVGRSSPSVMVTATPTNLPSAPSITAASSQIDSLLVYFNPPTNTAGTAIVDYRYTVNDAEAISAGTITSPIRISGLNIGSTYTIQIKAVNYAGEGSGSNTFNATLGAPDAPTIEYINYSNASKIDLSYAQGDDGGAPILNYEYSLNDSATWTALNPASTDTPITIPGAALTNNTRYSVRLRAINERGAGLSSTAAYIARGLTNIPEIKSVEPLNEAILVKVLAPGNYVGTIVGYKYSLNNAPYVLSIQEPITDIVIDNLINGTEYSIKVIALYATGQESPPSLISTATPGTPAAPTGLSAVGGNQKITVSFTPPTNNTGFNILNYSYDVWPASDTEHTENWQDLNPIKTTSPITIPVPTTGISYNFKIRASNQLGYGASSTQGTALTRFETPSAPIIQNILPGNSTLTIAFSSPISDGGKPITSYKYSLNAGVTKINYNKTSSPIEINNLSNGTNYSVILYAVNEVGTGAPSASILAIPAAGATPSAPQVTSIDTSTARKAFIHFNPPSNNGGSDIVRYQYRLNDDDWVTRKPANLLASPIEIADLRSNTEYKIRIRAVNSSGAGASSAAFILKTAKTPPGIPTIKEIDYRGEVEIDGITQSIPRMSIGFKFPEDDGGENITFFDIDLDVIDIVANENNPSPGWVLDPASYFTIDENYYGSISKGNYDRYDISFSDLYEDLVIFSGIMIRARNSVGVGEWSEPIFWSNNPDYIPLRAPTGMQVIPLSTTSLEISFTPPSNPIGTDPIQGYKYSLDGGASYSSPVNAPNNTIVVSGLEPGRYYDITLLAYNGGVNNGEPSTSVHVATNPDVPSPPTIYSITGLNQQLVVYFTPPSIPGGTISNYEYSLNGVTYVSGNTTASPITISNTTNEVEYSVTVRAINQVGASLPSNEALGLSGKPAAPSITDVVADTVRGNRLNVFFDPPLSDGGSQITNYHYSINGGASFVSAETDASPIYISGLTNGQVYSIALKAQNATYLGIASQTVSAKPFTVPTAPTITQLVVDYTKIGSATIQFSPPANDGGSPVLGYKYSINRGISWIPANVVSGNTIVITTPKTSGESYGVSLLAFNDAGNGASSNALNFSPVTAPSAPTITLSQVIGNLTSINLTISPNQTGGAPITHYSYTVFVNNNSRIPETYISSATTTLTIPQSFSFGDYVAVVVRAINFGIVGSSPVTVNSGVSPDAYSVIHISPSTITLPDNWLYTVSLLYTTTGVVNFEIGVDLPTNPSNTYVGTTLANMQPLATELDYYIVASGGQTSPVRTLSTSQIANKTTIEVPKGIYKAQFGVNNLLANVIYTLYVRAKNSLTTTNYSSIQLGYRAINTSFITATPPVNGIPAPEVLNNQYLMRTEYGGLYGAMIFSGSYYISANFSIIEILVDVNARYIVCSIESDQIYTLKPFTSSSGTTPTVEMALPVTSASAVKTIYDNLNSGAAAFPAVVFVEEGQTVRNFILKSSEEIPAVPGSNYKEGSGGKKMVTVHVMGLAINSTAFINLRTKDASGTLSLNNRFKLNTSFAAPNTPPAMQLVSWSPKLLPSQFDYNRQIRYLNYNSSKLLDSYQICPEIYDLRGKAYYNVQSAAVVRNAIEVYRPPDGVFIFFRHRGAKGNANWILLTNSATPGYWAHKNKNITSEFITGCENFLFVPPAAGMPQGSLYPPQKQYLGFLAYEHFQLNRCTLYIYYTLQFYNKMLVDIVAAGGNTSNTSILDIELLCSTQIENSPTPEASAIPAGLMSSITVIPIEAPVPELNVPDLDSDRYWTPTPA